MSKKEKRIDELNVPNNLRIKDVVDAVELSRNTIYRLMEKYQFPQKIKLSQGLVAWRETEVNQFRLIGPDGWYEKYGQHQQAEMLAQQA